MTGQNVLSLGRSTVEPLMHRIIRAVEVPRAGHWLVEENPEFVLAELVTFLA